MALDPPLHSPDLAAVRRALREHDQENERAAQPVPSQPAEPEASPNSTAPEDDA